MCVHFVMFGKFSESYFNNIQYHKKLLKQKYLNKCLLSLFKDFFSFKSFLSIMKIFILFLTSSYTKNSKLLLLKLLKKICRA